MCAVYFTFHLKSAFVLNNAVVRRCVLLCPFVIVFLKWNVR